jgi:hypothetical protein
MAAAGAAALGAKRRRSIYNTMKGLSQFVLTQRDRPVFQGRGGALYLYRRRSNLFARSVCFFRHGSDQRRRHAQNAQYGKNGKRDSYADHELVHIALRAYCQIPQKQTLLKRQSPCSADCPSRRIFPTIEDATP